MSVKGLVARLAKLEAKQHALPERFHRIIQRIGELEAMALERYQREAGVEIDPLDLVILRVIVDPLEWRTA